MDMGMSHLRGYRAGAVGGGVKSPSPFWQALQLLKWHWLNILSFCGLSFTTWKAVWLAWFFT
eukprot:CAMPEP_0206453146 /NCGR_PEP_ID=MMETSP0324_2-20121206/20364_1 /ASSEMBLY_ACC=CAM_ASM_000836 /TAXON_ID=2866 /ORGANISM="Crypthecodinium cohnii, Strain Seligo" /LENGTH=61 /DNA_ID=CAMNT_0053923365 /DNA_START=182 /DNA_END=367 /DNA_ORIENTATION=-